MSRKKDDGRPPSPRGPLRRAARSGSPRPPTVAARPAPQGRPLRMTTAAHRRRAARSAGPPAPDGHTARVTTTRELTLEQLARREAALARVRTYGDPALRSRA